MAQLSITRLPRGERATQDFVNAVVSSDDRIEHHYLELKSEVDLSTKRDQAKLAKFILGAANRMPGKAAMAFEGYAVMVIGVSAGALVGVPVVEVLDIEKAVMPFLGADGPTWDLARVPVPESKNEVLLLIVDPPEWGQAPYLCRKDGGEKNELRDGAIYYRASGETREAKSAEIGQLFRRGATTNSPDVQLDVRVAGVVTQVDRDKLDQLLDEYIESQTAKLELALALAKRPQPRPSDASFGATGLASAYASFALGNIGDLTKEPESRSEDEYRTEIRRWGQECRTAWEGAVMRFLGGALPTTQVEIINNAQTFFEDAKVKVHLAGSVVGVEATELDDDTDAQSLGMPRPPRSWGPTNRILGLQQGNWMQAGNYGQLDLGTAPSRTTWSNSGSVDVGFDIGELRPLATETTDDLDLVLLTTTQEEAFEGTWQVTARGHHALYSGALSVGVAEEPNLLAELRMILQLPNREAL